MVGVGVSPPSDLRLEGEGGEKTREEDDGFTKECRGLRQIVRGARR